MCENTIFFFVLYKFGKRFVVTTDYIIHKYTDKLYNKTICLSNLDFKQFSLIVIT